MKRQTCRLFSLVLCAIMTFCSFSVVRVEAGNDIIGSSLNAYSIAQGGSLTGKMTTKSIHEGATMKFELVGTLDPANGTVELNSSTGEWTYTTPSADFVQKDRSGVNFWIKTSDGYGNFTTRIQINVEPTPTYLTYYVDGDTGDDSNDGLSYEKALKTINRANEIVKPGDTVLVYETEIPYAWHEKEEYDSTPGLYQKLRNGAVALTTSGLPDAPITYKAADGQKPVIKANGVWKTVLISGNYINFEGFTVLGQADELDYEGAFAAFIGKIVPDDDPDRVTSWDYPSGLYNTNGISIETEPNKSFNKGDQDKETSNVAHHIKIDNCIVKNLPSTGIGSSLCDYVTISNCTVMNNGWWDMWASSGINFIKTVDIDDNNKDYKLIVKNCISAGNRHFIPWKVNNDMRLSDGNGIMFDTTNGWEFDYKGKSLVANNLVYENGASGIHSFRSNNVDIINNTVFNNGATPHLGWADVRLGDAENFNIYNNIVYTRTGNDNSAYFLSVNNRKHDNNIFYNGKSISEEPNSDGTPSPNNLVGVDPKFVNVSSVKRSDAYKPEGFNTATDYPTKWYETKTAASGYSPQTWTFAGNAEKAGWYPNANYDAASLDYDVTLAPDSPAHGAANAEWQAIAGGSEYDNVIGIFSQVGAQIEPTENILRLKINTAKHLPDTNQIFVEAYLNENLKSLDGTLFFALYDDTDRLIGCSSKVSSESPQYTFDGLDDYKGSYTVKVFYWENLTNLVPLYKSVPTATVKQDVSIEDDDDEDDDEEEEDDDDDEGEVVPNPITTILRRNTFDENDNYSDWFTNGSTFADTSLRNFYYGNLLKAELDGSQAAMLTREGSNKVNIAVSPVAPADLYTKYLEEDLYDCKNAIVFQEDINIPAAGQLQFRMRKVINGFYGANIGFFQLNPDFTIDVNDGSSSGTDVMVRTDKKWKTNTTYTITLYYNTNPNPDLSDNSITCNLYFSEKGEVPEKLLSIKLPPNHGINRSETFTHFYTEYVIDGNDKPVLYVDNIYVYTQAGINLMDITEAQTFNVEDGIQVNFTNLVDANSLSGIEVSEKETGNKINANATINADMRSISIKSDEFDNSKQYNVSFAGVKGIFGTKVLKSTDVITAIPEN